MINAHLWHQRLGHAHPEAVIHLLKSLNHYPLSRSDFPPCHDCSLGKSTQYPATSPFHRSTRVLSLVHSDVLGPISPPTASGKKYILSFIDDHTRHNTVYLLSHKSEASETFKFYQKMMESKTGNKIGKLKSDRGGEYSSNEFTTYLKEQGIEEEKGPANRPTANSVGERFFRTLLARMPTQLQQSGYRCSCGVNLRPTVVYRSTALPQGLSTINALFICLKICVQATHIPSIFDV